MKNVRNILYIKLGWKCNEKCIFCAVAGDVGPSEYTFSQISEQLTLGRKFGADIFTISGGEPTVRKDLIRIVELAATSGYSTIHVQTNGRALANYDYMSKLVAGGVSKFVVSVHGDKPELHDGLTLTKGGFAQTVRGIRNLLSLDIERLIRTNTTILNQNWRSVPSIVKFLESLGVPAINLSYIQPSGAAKSIMSKLSPKMSSVAEHIEVAIKEKHKATQLTVDGIPPCLFSPQYRHLVRNQLYPKSIPLARTETWNVYKVMSGYTVDAGGHVVSYPGVLKILPPAISISEEEEIEDLVFSNSCECCSLRQECPGVWPYYEQLYGLDEFYPIAC